MYVVDVDSSILNHMVEKIKGVVGNANFDSLLPMQYAFSVLCAQEVWQSPVVLIGRAGYWTNCVGNLGLFGTHLVNVGVKCSMNSRDHLISPTKNKFVSFCLLNK